MRKLIVFVVIILSLLFTVAIVSHADEYDDITHQLENLKRDLDASQKATQNNQQNLDNLNKQLDSIKYQVSQLEKQIAQKTQEVQVGEEALTYQKNILDKRTVSYYKNLNNNSFSLVNMVAADNLSKSLEQFFYQKSLIDDDQKTIMKVVSYIKDLQDKKASLETQNKKLAVIKDQVSQQSTFLAGEVAKSKQYESQLQSKIAVLTARQQQIIAEKLSSLNIPQSAYTSQRGCSDDRSVDPGFGNRFAAFTFGVPNRVGLNQYGAKGRAEAGQNYETILQAYYSYDSLSSVDTGTTIRVNDGNGFNTGNIIWSGSLEDYMKRIYEVPNGWPAESLKAQAVAARSYVLASTNNGSASICANENCQAFQTNPKGGDWESAVNDTAGKVMMKGGQPIKAWFSSTHGGIIHSSAEIGWSDTSWTKHGNDTPSGSVSDFADLMANAFDKGSPWFYCDWGSRAQYNHTAWLKTDELADIANTLSLAKRDGSIVAHLTQVDQPNPEGVDTWDAERVKAELRNRGGNPINTVSDISVDWDRGSGKTTSVHINGDTGSVTFDAGEFKSYFNVRAPANIQIVGPLYNFEHR